MKNNARGKLYKNRFIIAGLVLTIFFSILFITYRVLQKEVFYTIEVKSNYNILLSFDKNDIVIDAECKDDNCNLKDVNRLIDLKYDELKEMLPQMFDEDIKIRLVSGDKDISSLKLFFIKEDNVPEENLDNPQEETNTDNEVKDTADSKDDDEIKPSNPVPNDKPNDKPNAATPSDPQNFTPLDITFMWIWGYSGHDVKFTHYSTVPMKYKNYGDATKFYSGGVHMGYVQLFDLKSQGITQNDACVTFTYLDENKNSPGASSVVPVYTGGEVTYRKFCFGLKDIGYNKNYNEITADATSDYTNIYEWINNGWMYIGKFEDIKFNLRHYHDYMDSFYITNLPELAYGWVQNEQREEFKNQIMDAIEEVDKQIEENRANMTTDPDWNTKDTELRKVKDKLVELYDENVFLEWYDYSKLVEK